MSDKDSTEKLQQHEQPKKGFKALAYTSMALIIIFALIMLVNFIQGVHIRNIYNEGKALCLEGQYQSAIEQFEQISELNYKDTGAFISYSKARLCYNQGRLDDAAADMVWASFHYLSDEEAQQIDEFRTQLDREYDEADFKPGEYRMEFYPDADEFYYYHGQDFDSYEDCERFFFVNQKSR